MSAVEVGHGADAGLVWHYGDPFAEQRAMQAGDAVVELGNREVFTVSGAERLSWLHTLTAQDLTALEPGGAVDVVALSATGQIAHWFVLIDDGETAWCWTEPGAREALVGWLEKMKFWTPVEIAARDDLRLVWVGRRVGVPAEAVASRVSTVGLGHEVLLGVDAPTPAGTPAGQWAHEALRIEAGLPRIGHDTDERTLPNEIGLFGTALDKGCYPGQETVARVHNLGRPPRRLVRLLFDGQLPAAESPILAGDKQVGVVGSTAQHHELGPVGLALIKRSVAIDAVLAVGGVDAAQEPLVDPEVGEHFRPQL